MARYLTKSRYILGLNCPTKLYYTGKPEYPDESQGDSFLEALAEGGYQVGALAKCYFPDGMEIKQHDYDNSLAETMELMTNNKIVLFEAAFKHQNQFVRADIIEKTNKVINLYEVKAKSFDGNDSIDMLKKDGFIKPDWKEYLYDVAFQKYVISKNYPDHKVHAHLMLADKNAVATVNGLNQKFQIKKIIGDRTVVEVKDVSSKADLGNEVLIRVNVDDLIDMIWNGTDTKSKPALTYEEHIDLLASHYAEDKKLFTSISKNCKECEFQASAEQISEGLKSGFRECWKSQLNWSDRNFNAPLVFDLWSCAKKDELLENGIYYLKDIPLSFFGEIQSNSDGSLTAKERQWLQVEKVVNSDPTPYININGLRREFNKFKYPLHFIDFETTQVAIPFYQGRRPYEQVAFQFSHHIVNDDLTIEHKGEYICYEKGKFPNFEFLKKLKDQLKYDDGTVFRYAMHENTVLNQILKQLNDADINVEPDKDELIGFIKTITQGANHLGTRNMVDLKDLVVKYYYHPQTKGSNSLKYVLPAVLSSSDYLQDKYSRPVYGKNSMIKSKNYPDGWIWIKKDQNGQIINPYKLLPELYDDITEETKRNFLLKNSIREGGAAMTAYGVMQFTDIPEHERDLIKNGLLKYCELDTLAMVMIWEYWNNLIHKS